MTAKPTSEPKKLSVSVWDIIVPSPPNGEGSRFRNGRPAKPKKVATIEVGEGQQLQVVMEFYVRILVASSVEHSRLYYCLCGKFYRYAPAPDYIVGQLVFYFSSYR